MTRSIPLLAFAFALLLAAPVVAEEPILLRGSGSDVWIEGDDGSRPKAKGFTRVETSPNPVVNRQHNPERRVRNGHLSLWVGVGDPHPHYYHHPHVHTAHCGHVHDYTPVYHYPRAYRHRVPHYGVPYRSHRSYRSYGSGPHPAGTRPLGSTTTGHTLSGGAYRR